MIILRRRILVVDDEEFVLFVLSSALKKLGSDVEIVTARNGSEALRWARQSPFDLLITDLRMPVMNGVQLTEAVRDLSPETAVIWMTAYGSYMAQADAERLGVRHCLDKPLTVGQIRQVAGEVLNGMGPDLLN
jgi:YesN/AraC family two-component response regulator